MNELTILRKDLEVSVICGIVFITSNKNFINLKIISESFDVKINFLFKAKFRSSESLYVYYTVGCDIGLNSTEPWYFS